MSKALQTCNKLKLFWRKTNASTAWKIQIHNAIMGSQLVYGLNTLNITPAIRDQVNGSHMRGLRYILDIEHSHHSHISNKEAIDKVNLTLNNAEAVCNTWEQFIVLQTCRPENMKRIRLVGTLCSTDNWYC